MSNGHKWTTALKMDELWLNSDREILGRATKEAGKVGIVMTLILPNGEHFQAEVERLNADTGGSYCQMAREYYDEWKASKEASSRRKQRDRSESTVLDETGSVARTEPPAGETTVEETVQALQESVQGASTLEEEVIHRIDAAYNARAKLREMSEELARDLAKIEAEITQLEQMREIFNASRVLEAASNSVPEATPDPEAGVDTEAHSPEDGARGSEEAERGSAED